MWGHVVEHRDGGSTRHRSQRQIQIRRVDEDGQIRLLLLQCTTQKRVRTQNSGNGAQDLDPARNRQVGLVHEWVETRRAKGCTAETKSFDARTPLPHLLQYGTRV